VDKVEDFTGTLKKNDTTVRRFNDSLAQGADLLADERQDLAAVLRNLNVALVEVRSFVHENRASLSSNIAGLNQISKTLVKRRDALDQILHYAPDALNNLFLAGNVPAGTLDVRTNLSNLLNSDPVSTLCALVNNDTACNTIKGALGNVTAPLVPRTAALGRTAPAKPTVVEPTDATMGGLLGVDK
jgi:phospholipid/cholesterol/gamma-HCH transport system substrate-binding protein